MKELNASLHFKEAEAKVKKIMALLVVQNDH